MLARTAASIALISAATSVVASPAEAQRTERARLMVPAGLSLLAPGRFSQAYDGGDGLGITVAVLVRGVWLRAGVEAQLYPYDEARFFDRLGMSSADLGSQFGEYATLWSWFLGPEFVLRARGPIEWYGLATVGGAVRRPQGFLVYMYCTPTNVFTVVGDTIRSVRRTPPPACDEARSETRISGTALGAQLGTGVRWHRRRSFAFLEGGVAAWLLAPPMTTFPIRGGWGWTF